MTVTTSPTTTLPGTTVPPAYLRRAGTWLVITTLAYFLVNGAQVFETATIVPAWAAAPPESLAVFHGPYGLDFMVFWIVAHSLHELTFLLAIAFSWRIAPVRRRLLALLAVHVALRVWTVAYFAPTIIELQGITGTGVDPALLERAALWQDLNYLRVGLFIAVSLALLPVVGRLLGPGAATRSAAGDEFPTTGGSEPATAVPTPRTEPPMSTMNATPTHTPSRAANIGLWTLQVLLAAVYAFSAYGKLTADPQNVAGFEAMGLGTPGMYIIGALELAGAIAMFVPRLTGLAALCFVALMIGAVIATLAVGGGMLAVIPAVVLVLVAIVAWGRRDSTRALVAQLRR